MFFHCRAGLTHPLWGLLLPRGAIFKMHHQYENCKFFECGTPLTPSPTKEASFESPPCGCTSMFLQFPKCIYGRMISSPTRFPLNLSGSVINCITNIQKSGKFAFPDFTLINIRFRKAPQALPQRMRGNRGASQWASSGSSSGGVHDVRSCFHLILPFRSSRMHPSNP